MCRSTWRRRNRLCLPPWVRLPLTRNGGSLQFASSCPESRVLNDQGGAMSEEPRESLEAVRMGKLRRIADLGLDPWGGRFDGHQTIARVRELPVPKVREGEPAVPGPTVRVAGRI